MTDLFRYIEHAFAIPQATPSIDVANESDFQSALQNASTGDNAYDNVRADASDFLTATFTTPASDPVSGTAYFAEFRARLKTLTTVSTATVTQLVEQVFGEPPNRLVSNSRFVADRQLLQNAIVAIKVVTGFDRADAATLARSLQVVELIDDLAAGRAGELTRQALSALLERPMRVPANLLIAPPAPADSAARGTNDEPGVSEAQRLVALRERRDQLRATYDSLLALQPAQLSVTAADSAAEPAAARPSEPAAGHFGAEQDVVREERERGTTAADSTALPGSGAVYLGDAGLQTLTEEQRAVLAALPVDAATMPLPQVVDAVKRQWVEVNREVLPAEVPGRARVYQVGGHTFAVADAPRIQALSAPAPIDGGPEPNPPDFSHAITRPIGYGNLLVVRQELIGYQAGDISHIENVLEGEVLKRSTRREEVNETTITDETDSSSSQERDQQSTDRNELSAETQKESGQSSTSSTDLSSSSDYGKLVENSKTNYAQSVTSKATDTITSMVKQQRVQREKKTFVEHAVHELDNKAGAKNIRGIYQWVDKTYSVRVLNYGKRLLYDVVVPEPAAFLVQSLTDAVQPESFQLSKPTDPGIEPYELDVSNYAYYAAQYGVTGSVSPPPQEYMQAVAHVDAQDVQKELNSFGAQVHGWYYSAFTIHVPENYRAVSGYIQRTNELFVGTPPGRSFEFFVGASHYFRFGPGDTATLNASFTMAGETGDIPVTFNSLNDVAQFNYAIGINCQRTDDAYAKWQLATHATIVAGYQRQLADYLDKLGRYTAAVRAQLAAAGNYAHDPSIEQEELKKAFIYLLLGEHYGSFLPTPTPAPVPPYALPPDPAAVKAWGAMVAFFERAFEWENVMYTFYPYFWGRPQRWEELILTQDPDPQFEAFLKAGAARLVVAVRPGFEAALAHYQETGDLWLGEEIPDMFSDNYVSIIAEIKAANYAPGKEVCVDQWQVTLPTTLVMLKDDATLPSWPESDCTPAPEQ